MSTNPPPQRPGFDRMYVLCSLELLKLVRELVRIRPCAPKFTKTRAFEQVSHANATHDPTLGGLGALIPAPVPYNTMSGTFVLLYHTVVCTVLYSKYLLRLSG